MLRVIKTRSRSMPRATNVDLAAFLDYVRIFYLLRHRLPTDAEAVRYFGRVVAREKASRP